jgi:hypothetical protein
MRRGLVITEAIGASAKTVTIYARTDAASGEVRYIGRTAHHA